MVIGSAPVPRGVRRSLERIGLSYFQPHYDYLATFTLAWRYGRNCSLGRSRSITEVPRKILKRLYVTITQYPIWHSWIFWLHVGVHLSEHDQPLGHQLSQLIASNCELSLHDCETNKNREQDIYEWQSNIYGFWTCSIDINEKYNVVKLVLVSIIYVLKLYWVMFFFTVGYYKIVLLQWTKYFQRYGQSYYQAVRGGLLSCQYTAVSIFLWSLLYNLNTASFRLARSRSLRLLTSSLKEKYLLYELVLTRRKSMLNVCFIRAWWRYFRFMVFIINIIIIYIEN